jgi:hypothetical protein
MKLQSGDEESTKRLYEALQPKMNAHPFMKRYINAGVKEGLFSDGAGALGKMHDTLVRAAHPILVGRNIIEVMPSTEAVERFPLDAESVAYEFAENGATRLSGKKKSTVDIYTNVLAEASEEWTKEFTEDATWNVMNNMVELVGRALGKKETEKIIALYAAVANGDLAGGAEVAGGGAVCSWATLLAGHNAVESEDFMPNVFGCHIMQKHQLLNDDKFVNSLYLPSGQTDVDRASIGEVLGMSVQASSLFTNGVAYAIDTRIAAAMLLRRDVTVEDWYNPQTGKYGVRATTRFGLGVLRSKGVARISNIKTTLT